MDQSQEKFDLWCIVELFGHNQIAGRCTEQNIAGTNFLRVDVPETKIQGSFTKFFGAGAIYAINPVEEDVCKLKAESLNVKPIEAWSIKEMQKKLLEMGQQQGRIPYEEGQEQRVDEDDLPW